MCLKFSIFYDYAPSSNPKSGYAIAYYIKKILRYKNTSIPIKVRTTYKYEHFKVNLT